MRRDVGIGEYHVSKAAGDEIKTYALGSCVAVVAYDSRLKIAGMIHIALPDSQVSRDKAQRLPGYFADTGLPVFFKELQKQGSILPKLSIKLVGGASIMDKNNTFDIGRRNVIAIKRYLWKNALGVLREDIGGENSRTVAISVDDGIVKVSNSMKKMWEL